VIHRRRELAATSPNGLYSIADYNGYQPGSSSAITGGLPHDTTARPASVEVAWPIPDVATAKGGSATYGALAPIAATDFEYGSGLRRLSPLDLTARAQFADAVSLAPLNGAVVTSISVEIQSQLDYQNVAQASPATVSGDRLVWRDPAVRAEGVRYVLHDPVGEGEILRRTFLGGVIGGLAASLLVWAVQLGLERR
jgi:hypothetical protein